MSETADTVPAGERRFKLMEMPCDEDWPCKLEADMLELLPAAVQREWVARDRIAQKLDFLIREAVQSNNANFHLETKVYLLEKEVKEGKQFLETWKKRAALFSVCFALFVTVFGRAIGDRLGDKFFGPRQPTNERRDTKSP